MAALTRIALDFVLREGAVASGIATAETCSGPAAWLFNRRTAL